MITSNISITSNICGRNKCYTYLKINKRLKKKRNFKFPSKHNRALKLYIYINYKFIFNSKNSILAYNRNKYYI